MSRVKPAASSEGERRSLYEEITSQIIAELEAGRIPWVKPWAASRTAHPWACR